VSNKKRGVRPVVPFVPETPARDDPRPPAQPEGYQFSFTISPADSQLIAQLAHRNRVTPGDVMQRGVEQFLTGLRMGGDSVRKRTA
jgi:hypothetical protein